MIRNYWDIEPEPDEEDGRATDWPAWKQVAFVVVGWGCVAAAFFIGGN